ncbi:MAG: class I SAM-dependent methyltransferase [Ignavibacteriales bacterium]|nr:class I SAM-dependent methyltransferase [Ignavibacteriales bacterium]
MIGEEIRQQVFRDTQNYYHGVPPEMVSRPLMRFVRRFAGKKILDVGCATGNYCRALAKEDFDMTGADANAEYVRMAKERGVNAIHVHGRLPFEDRSFDTVLLFEVLEHVEDPVPLIREALRVSRKNVLVTVPNSSNADEMRADGLLYEHMADLDHKNFFTKGTLEALLVPLCGRVTVTEGGAMNPLALFKSSWIRWIGKVLTKSGVLSTRYHYKLYAVCYV